MSKTDLTKSLSRKIRAHALRMVHKAKASHIGSSLSIADLLSVLYGNFLKIDPNNPSSPDRDRYIQSKGHAAAILYSVLAETGFFPVQWLDTYCQNGTLLSGHVTQHGVPGVELSTGSLGHGLPVGCGMAIAGKRDNRPFKVCVMLSDGELNEGSNWEAILFAPQHQLDNLIAIVDYNKIQSFGRVSEVLELEPLANKWRDFRWAVREIDGHNHEEIQAALNSVPFETGKPSCIIAHTVKGKGVSFMEDQLAWHYKSPSLEQLDAALDEVTKS